MHIHIYICEFSNHKVLNYEHELQADKDICKEYLSVLVVQDNVNISPYFKFGNHKNSLRFRLCL